MQKRPHREAGMTLIELMMALVVLSIGLLSVAALFPLGSSHSTDDRLLTTASGLAMQKMEQLRMLPYSDAQLSTGTHPTTSGENIGTGGRFNRRWFVTQLATDLKSVDIRVTWSDAKPETARIVTYFKR
jgi:prepilin-type N-terminal cleavage/methylation domain-containing protein